MNILSQSDYKGLTSCPKLTKKSILLCAYKEKENSNKQSMQSKSDITGKGSKSHFCSGRMDIVNSWIQTQ